MRLPSAGFYLNPKRKDPFQAEGVFSFSLFGEDVNVQYLKTSIMLYLVRLALFIGINPAKTSPIASDVHLHVVYDTAQDKWLLNRVLYGAYIVFPKLEE